MEDMKSQLTRLNVVFEGGAGKGVYDLPEILRISNVGSIYTMVVKEYNEGFSKKLYKLGASLVEPVDISLEELFVVLEETQAASEQNQPDRSKNAGKKANAE
jgi:ABC-2 type transport system ATP-binding protein